MKKSTEYEAAMIIDFIKFLRLNTSQPTPTDTSLIYCIMDYFGKTNISFDEASVLFNRVFGIK